MPKVIKKGEIRKREGENKKSADEIEKRQRI